ncbi:hypothetical protein VaNZ11_006604 [Volvox africanus]|uniref:Protein kinase domain-containing protein n=1 Tax=Volvox africanus TaxID=51714 RepID=A0ABQ5S2C0_9CHLO|nr:hypothetical protein VaNZ11_006604 [Volvox africanus]
MSRVGFIVLVSVLLVFPSRLCFTATTSPSAANKSNLTLWCRTGEELVAAIANPVVNYAVLVTDVFVTEAHFNPYTKPMVVQRNFTIMGYDPFPASWPVLDLGFVTAWVQVDPGCTFGLTNLALQNYRQGPHFQGPGYDIFIGPTFLRPARQPPSPAATVATAGAATASDLPGPLILQWNSSLIQRTCLPNSIYNGSVPNLPRPGQVPGNQSAVRLPLPANCSSHPGASTMTRCWPAWGVYSDVASKSYQEVSPGQWAPAGIVLHLLEVNYMCNTLMDEECAARLGTVGCFYSMFPRGISSESSSISRGISSGSGGKRDASEKVVIIASTLGCFLLLLTVTVAVAVFLNRHRSDAAGTAMFGACSFPPGVWDTGNCVGRNRAGSWSVPDHLPSPAACVGVCVETVPPGPQQAVDADVAAAAEDVLMPLQQRTTNPCRQRQSHFQPHAGARQSGAQSPGDMALVTSHTPLSPSIDYDVQVMGGELEVDPGVVLGKGNYGRVLQGRYQGERVAVKFINSGLLGDGCFQHPGVPVDVGGKRRTDAAEEPGGRGPGAGVSWKNDDDLDGGTGTGTGTGVGTGTGAGTGTGTGTGSSEVYVSAAPASEDCGALHHDHHYQQQEQQPGDAPRPLSRQHSSELPVWPQRAFVQEVEVLGRCQHPNIVKLLAANMRPPRICLVMELMDTNLERLMYGDLKRPGRQLPVSTVVHIGMQIARALSYLHPTILHRDIKPANVLISAPDSPAPVVKLGDFGLSRLLQTALVTANPEAGTTPYMAPEVFDTNNNTITDRADMYGFGVVMWEMLAGQRPWDGFTHLQIAVSVAVLGMHLPLHNIGRGNCPAKLQSLICSCWEHDPARRPAAAEAYKTLALVQEGLTRLESRQPETEAAAPPTATTTVLLSPLT